MINCQHCLHDAGKVVQATTVIRVKGQDGGPGWQACVCTWHRDRAVDAFGASRVEEVELVGDNGDSGAGDR